MRIAMKKGKSAGPALLAAALSAWLATPAAHAGFNIQVLGPYTDPENSADQIYVATAQNEGTGGSFAAQTGVGVNTGSLLDALDVEVTTNTNNLVVDVEGTAGRSSTTYTANIDGTTKDAADGNQYPVFGDGNGGTYIGIGGEASIPGSGELTPTSAFVNTPYSVSQSTYWSTLGGTTKVYFNANASNPLNPVASPSTALYAGQPSSTLDPALQKPAGTVTTGASANNSLTALEVVEVASQGSLSGNVQANQFAIPFANIVVPKGTSGTVQGELGGDQPGDVPFDLSFGSAPPPSVTLSLTGSAPSGSNQIGAITISGHNGSYVPISVSVSGAAQSNGYLSVSGFTSGDEEIYALTATPGSGETLAALIAELNTAASTADAGAQAVAITPTIAHLFPTADIEVDIPGADGSNPAVLAYNLTGDSTGPSITAIGVVPEPTSIGFLVLSSVGLMIRRRRAMQA